MATDHAPNTVPPLPILQGHNGQGISLARGFVYASVLVLAATAGHCVILPDDAPLPDMLFCSGLGLTLVLLIVAGVVALSGWYRRRRQSGAAEQV